MGGRKQPRQYPVLVLAVVGSKGQARKSKNKQSVCWRSPAASQLRGPAAGVGRVHPVRHGAAPVQPYCRLPGVGWRWGWPWV